MPHLSDIVNVPSINELTSKADEAEKLNKFSLAIELYYLILKIYPLQTHAYNRLMISYRQEKDYKKELTIINLGIKTFEKFFKEQSRKAPKKISELSEKLNKAFHLIDKKGNSLYTPEPIAGWQKRKQVVQKKIEKVQMKK